MLWKDSVILQNFINLVTNNWAARCDYPTPTLLPPFIAHFKQF